ncbi:MAG: tyrosine-type recombinase/integrase [Clostridium sp.]
MNSIKDKEQVRQLLKILEAQNPIYYLMASTGLYTGLRISDILRIKVRDVRGKNRLYIKTKKTGKVMTIPLNEELIAIYKKYLTREWRDNDFLVKDIKKVNAPLSRQKCWEVLSEAGKGVKNLDDRIGTHTLRKTFGWVSYETSEYSISKVQKLLGHKSEAHTMDYIGITRDELKKVILGIKY